MEGGRRPVEVTDRFIEFVLDDNRGLLCRVITYYKDGSTDTEEMDYWEVLETIMKEQFGI